MDRRIAEAIVAAAETRDERPLEAREPRWWDGQHTSAWARGGLAVEREWLVTRASSHLPGGPELGREPDCGDLPVSPSTEPEPLTWEQARRALRFGYGAAIMYGDRHSGQAPGPEVAAHLAYDWETLHTGVGWSRVRLLALHGFRQGLRDREP